MSSTIDTIDTTKEIKIPGEDKFKHSYIPRYGVVLAIWNLGGEIEALL